MIVLLAVVQALLGVVASAGLILAGLVAPGLALLLVSAVLTLGAWDFMHST